MEGGVLWADRRATLKLGLPPHEAQISTYSLPVNRPWQARSQSRPEDPMGLLKAGSQNGRVPSRACRRQGFEAHEPKRGFHAKFFVEGLLRIADRTNGIFFWYDRIDLAEE